MSNSVTKNSVLFCFAVLYKAYVTLSVTKKNFLAMRTVEQLKQQYLTTVATEGE